MADSSGAPRVLISYSHDSDDHRARIVALANQLRADGVAAWIDQFDPFPEEGWPRWMKRQIREADFVVLVCTETYRRRYDGSEEAGKGRGVTWEGLILSQLQYEGHGRTSKLIPTRFFDASETDIPDELRPLTSHTLAWPLDIGASAYVDLLRRIFREPAAVPASVGARRALPKVTRLHPGLPGSVARAKALHTGMAREALQVLLKSCFANNGLARLVRFHSMGGALRGDLPDTWISPNQYVTAFVDVLEEQESFDDEFVDLWRSERPRRTDEIDRVVRMWRLAHADD